MSKLPDIQKASELTTSIVSLYPAPNLSLNTSNTGLCRPVHVYVENPSACTLSQPLHVYVENNAQPSLLSQPALWIGLAAISISIYTLFTNTKKDEAARQKSIDDDFWIRKVLFEFSLSPTLKFMADIADSLPRYESRREVRKFLSEFGTTHRELSGKLSVGAVLDEALFKNTLQTFVDFEECISEYCSKLMDSGLDKAMLSSARSEAVIRVRDLSVEMLKCVKNYQQLLK